MHQLPIVFTADTTGAVGRGKGGQTLMNEWMAGFPVRSGETVTIECDGEVLDEADWTGKVSKLRVTIVHLRRHPAATTTATIAAALTR